MTVTVGLLAIAACTADTESDITRTDLAGGGKADVTLAEKFCREHGAPASCDPCEAGGFYGDGSCDLFCHRTDEDCSEGGLLRCEALSEDVVECVESWRRLPDCIPEEVGHDLESCCQQDWEYSFCPVVTPARLDRRELVHNVIVPAYDLAGLPAGTHGAHRYFAFDPNSTDSSSVIAEIQRSDSDVRSCSDREYSASNSRGAALYRAFIEAEDPFGDSYLFYFDRNLIADVERETNLGVLANVPTSSKPECQYHEFVVLGPDRGGIHLFFDDRPEPREELITLPLFRYVDITAVMQANAQNEYSTNAGDGASVSILLGDLDMERVRRHAISSLVTSNSATMCALNWFSRSSQEGIELFDRIMEAESLLRDESERPGFMDDADSLRAYLQDDDTIGVFASFHDRSVSSDCDIDTVYVLRSGGTLLTVQWNQEE